MIGSLHKSRLLVSIACRSTTTRRSFVYRVSQHGDRDTVTDADDDTVSVSGGTASAHETVDERRRRNATGRVRRASFGNDGPSKSPESTSANEIPYAVKKMRERMREKYGLECANVDRENNVADNTFVESASVNVKHTASHNKYENHRHHGLIDDSFTDATNTAHPMKQSEYKDLFQKFSFLQTHKVTDKVMDMTFGAVRLDSMNQPLHHGDRDRFDLHKDDLDPEGGFKMDHLPGHIEQDHTPPESMASDTWQHSNPYNDKMHAKYHDYMDNQSFSEHDSTHTTQHTNDGYIDEQYFGTNDLSSSKAEKEQSSESAIDDFIEEQYFGTKDLSSTPETESDSDRTDDFIENQYFEYNQLSSDKQETATREASTTGNVFGQYFNSTESRLPKMPSVEVQPSKPQITNSASEQLNKTSTVGSDQHITSNAMSPSPDYSEGNLFDSQYFSDEMLSRDEHQSPRNHSVNSVKHMKTTTVQSSTAENSADAAATKVDYFGTMTKQEKIRRNQPVPDLQKPQTAFDLAMKIRLEKKGKLAVDENEAKVMIPSKMKWTGKVDSMGFRILEDQVLNLEYLTEDVITKILKDSIIYEDDEIIAVDKPYGLPSHGGPGVHHSMDRYTQPLAERLGHAVDKLHLVHRLDKETTGVFLLAKNEKVAWRLHQMFKKREVVKRYWVITKGVPDPTQGVIDIPMMEAEVQGKYRMALRPNYSSETKLLMKSSHKVNKFEAVTNYRVLDSYQSAALVECQPESGVKHQIRCHLAFGLNTPILGDHKYSHYAKIAPQKLYPDILQRLGVRQAKVRHIPMHLHAVNIILPEFNNGRNIFISARLPRHFVQNMKWLKLKVPKGK